MADLAVLRTAKMAMDEELITQEDYDAIRKAFTKAQMIKAGMDVGFVREEDYIQARNSFLHSLDFRVDAPAPGPVMPLMCTAPAHPQPRPPGGGPLTHAPGGGPLTAALATLGAGSRSSNGSAGPAPPALAPQSRPGPPPPMAPPAAATMMMMAAASRAGGGPAAAAAPPQNTSGELPGTIPIPTDLPRVGRAGVAEGKKSMSGIGVHDSCINLFNHIKTRSAFKWVSYKIDDAGAEVVVDQLGGPNSTYEQFAATLPSHQCRYAVYDYAYANNDTGQVNQKLVFIHWAPSGSTTKAKMVYASTREFLKGYLEGVGADLTADTPDELAESELVERIAASMARK